MIIISNKRNHVERPGFVTIYVGRPSDLGNPIKLESESKREECLSKYVEWLDGLPVEHKTIRALADLVVRYRAGQNLDLVCWCAPKRCHAEVIKAMILGAG